MAGYFTDWAIYSGYYPKNLITAGSADKLTHILYAFANLPAPGEAAAGMCQQLGGPWADYQLLKLKKRYPNLKLMISVGGWTWSAGFSSAASTDASRKALVASCIDTFIRGNFVDPANFSVTQPGLFDGIDIDWEFPGACGNTCAYSPDDTVNFTHAGEDPLERAALRHRRTGRYECTASRALAFRSAKARPAACSAAHSRLLLL
jgi:chitinase